MKNRRNLRFRFLRKFTAIIVSYNLIWFGTTSANIGAITGLIQGIGQQIIDSKVQTANILRQQQLIQQFRPVAVPSKMFPNCQVAQASPSFPDNACQSGDPAEAQAFLGVATQMRQFFEAINTPGQQSQFPQGIQCLEEQKALVQGDLQRNLDNLKGLEDRLGKEAQKYKDLLQDARDKIEDKEAFLAGRPGKSNSEDRNLRNILPQQCHQMLPEGDFIGPGAGLRKLRDSMRGHNDNAANFISKKETIKNNINSTVDKILADIRDRGFKTVQSEGGLQQLLQLNTTVGEELPGSAATVLQQEILKVQTDVNDKLDQVRQNIGGNFNPAFDEDFESNFQTTIDSTVNELRKQEVRNCMFESDFGLSKEEFLSLIEQRSATTNLNEKAARAKISEIFDEDRSFLPVVETDKDGNEVVTDPGLLTDLRSQLSGFGKEITITYSEKGETITESPIDYLQKKAAVCQQSLDFVQNGASDVAAGRDLKSFNQKVAEAKEDMQDIKRLISSLEGNIRTEITDQILNCKSRPRDDTTCSAASSAFDSNGAGFCWSIANECSAQVNGCFATINQRIVEVTAEKKQLAANFNAIAIEFKTKQEEILQSVKGQLQLTSGIIENLFRTGGATPPQIAFSKAQQALFIEFSEDPQFNSQLNEDLIFGGDMSKLTADELISKIQEMRGLAEDQNRLAEQSIDTHIADTLNANDANRTKWASLEDACQGVIDTTNQQIAQANEQQAEQQREFDQATGEFCQKYDGLVTAPNPAAGCDGPSNPKDLSGDIGRIISQLDPNVPGFVNKYMHICNQFNNEADAGTEQDDIDLAGLCESGDSDTVKTDLINLTMNSLPDNLRTNSDIQSFLNGEGDFPDIEIDSGIKNRLVTIKGQLNPSTSFSEETLNRAFEKYRTGSSSSSSSATGEGDTAKFREAVNTSLEGVLSSSIKENVDVGDFFNVLYTVRNDIDGAIEAGTLGDTLTPQLLNQVFPPAGSDETVADTRQQQRDEIIAALSNPQGVFRQEFKQALSVFDGSAETPASEPADGVDDVKNHFKRLTGVNPSGGIEAGDLDLCSRVKVEDYLEVIGDTSFANNDLGEIAKDFEDKVEKSLEREEKRINGARRSLASVGGTRFDEDWARLGEQAAGVCTARSGFGRSGVGENSGFDDPTQSLRDLGFEI